MRFLARRRWQLREGRLIDRRHIKKIVARFDSSMTTVSVDEYLVEFPGSGGTTKRLTIKAKSVDLPARDLQIGQVVPIQVNRRDTKAVFGQFHPVETRAERKRRERARRARDEARFKQKLGQ